MSSVITTLYALALITAKRIRAQIDLTAALSVGLIASLSLVVSIPLYADAVFNRLLKEGITQTTTSGEVLTRPTFGFLFNISGAVRGNSSWAEVQPLERYLESQASADLGLPFQSLITFLRTDPAAIFPADKPEGDHQGNLLWANLGTMTGFEDHIKLAEGRLPRNAAADTSRPVEALVSKSAAARSGLQIGQVYLASVPKMNSEGRTRYYTLPVRITGFWEAADPKEQYWFLPPSVLENMFFLTRSSFATRISTSIPDEIFSGYWYLVADGANVRADDVPAQLKRIAQMEANGRAQLEGVGIDWSPYNALVLFSQDARRLTLLLYAFSIPIAGLILAFLLLVSRLAVNRQRREIAIMRSRGVSSWAILMMMSIESLLLCGASLFISLPIAVAAASLIGQTRSFMTFFAASEMQIIISRTALTAGVAAVGFVFFANLSPGFGAIQKTIVSYQQQRARHTPVWWQRAGIDFLLLIPAGYSVFWIRQPEVDAQGGPFNNPILFLAPALFILALTLLFLRLIPPLMGGAARLLSYTTWVGPTMAARYLSRNPSAFSTPLVILVLTLSLSAYTSSIAQTLDLHLYDQTYYKVGSDLRFVESGRREATGEKISYYFTPIAEYRNIPRVSTAARVGAYQTGIEVKVGGMISGRYLGIDPADFRKAAFWRNDFAHQSLDQLMNALSQRADGVLASNSFLSDYGFQVGDTVNLVVNTFERTTRQDFVIVGSFDLFPTWYPVEGPLFVGNLDFLFERTGETYPYFVWLKTEPGIESIPSSAITQVNPAPISLESAPLNITKAQRAPERQGALGILFLGFAAAALLTMLGFLIYVVFSFRQRFIELSVLRASGMSIGQMTAYITSELASLILLGGLVGTVLGIAVSNLFIPYLQIGKSAADQVPPFIILIAWPAISQIYSLFGALFIVTLLILIFSLWHIKIFQAIKLGETV